MEAVEQALQCLPSPEAVVSLVNRTLEASIPSKDELGSEMRAIMEKRIQSAISEADIQEAMSRLLPDTDQILKIIRDCCLEESNSRRACLEYSRGRTRQLA